MLLQQPEDLREPRDIEIGTPTSNNSSRWIPVFRGNGPRRRRRPDRGAIQRDRGVRRVSGAPAEFRPGHVDVV